MSARSVADTWGSWECFHVAFWPEGEDIDGVVDEDGEGEKDPNVPPRCCQQGG
jgi:hypothetical protein